MMRRKPSSPTMGPSGVVNVVASALARSSRTLEAFRASGHATVALRAIQGGGGQLSKRIRDGGGWEKERRNGPAL